MPTGVAKLEKCMPAAAAANRLTKTGGRPTEMRLSQGEAEQRKREGLLMALSAHLSPALPASKTRPGLVSHVG